MSYQKVNDRHLAYFRTFIPGDRLLYGEAISEDYSHDERVGEKAMPELLIRVTSTEEISKVLAYANAEHIPVTTRGSGTGLVGGALPIYGGLVLETTLMNQILDFDEEDFTVTVQPGVLLMDLQQYATDRGYMYPPDPGEKTGTIGGNISTNAGGMRAVKYGVTRDYVRSLTVVLPDGRVEKLAGKVVKNSTGYSLKDLIIGSEGTLAVVAEAVLKVVPKPVCTVSLLIPFRDIDSALRCVPELIRSGTGPTAIEFMTRNVILFTEEYLGSRFPDKNHDAYLLLTYDGGSEEAVEENWSRAAELCIGMGAIDALIVDTEERQSVVWTARGAFLEAIKGSTTELDECDVVLPRTEVAGYIRFTHELEQEYGIRLPSFGHAGDGNLHIYICRDEMDDERWAAMKEVVFDRMYRHAFALGGLVSGEHGVGYAKRRYMLERLGEDQLALMRGIKKVFDPNDILNPGKVCEL